MEVIAPLTINLGTRWNWVVKFMPRPLHPRKEPRTHWGWMDPRAGLHVFLEQREIFPLPRFEPRTVQFVPYSLYTDYAPRAPFEAIQNGNILYKFDIKICKI
jgi:hypothetical protein